MPKLHEIEQEAVKLARAAGFAESEPVCAVTVAEHLGIRVLRSGKHAQRSMANLVRFNGELRVYVRHDLGEIETAFSVGHELGHHVLDLDSLSQENEDACDAFAARLLLPTAAFQVALREPGWNYKKLARWFEASESCIALRLGEVTGVPIALVAPERIRFRGDGYCWPERLSASTHLPGVRKTRLHDARGRVALRAHA